MDANWKASARRAGLRRAVVLVLGAVATTAGAQTPDASTGWKFGGTMDAGYLSATGNSQVTTISFGEKMVASRGNWTVRQVLAYIYGKTDGMESANELRLGLRGEYLLSKRFSGFAAVAYERNAHAGFEYRVDGLLGVQWYAFADPDDSVTFDAGNVFTHQSNTDGSISDLPSARTALAYKHVFRAKAFFTQSLEYIPALRGTMQQRTNAESAISAPLSTRIGLKLSYRIQYNSRPPDDFRTTDRIFTSGLQVTF